MKTVGIKLADGSFYPVMEEGTAQQKKLDLTTAHNNQTCVMVDLYRSENCTMEDAEYIDTLKIDNLVAHPNGEPDISFSVGLDENGQLTAQIEDPETGAKSDSNITLVNRTAEERLVTDDYTIEPSKLVEDEEAEDSGTEKTVNKGAVAAGVAGVAAGAGLLAMASALNKKKEEELVIEEPVETDSVDETIGEDNFDDMIFDEPASPEETDTEEVLVEDDAVVEDDFSDITIPDETSAEETVVEEVPTENETVAQDDFSDLTLPDESFAEETVEESFDDINIEDETTDEPLAEESFDDISIEDNSADETVENNFADINIEDETSEETVDDNFADINIEDEASDETIADDNFDNINIEDEKPSLDDLDDMDFEDNLDTNTSDNFAADSGLSFTGLYDKETEMGESAPQEEDDVKKKTKVPVIICIICAIICLIATALLLFVIPSKYNLISKKNNKSDKRPTVIEIEDDSNKNEVAAINQPVEEPEETVPEAKEDEVIIIEKAEEVVPLPPPVIEEKPKDITYKIKWGDTLWDIADTYYKNPWRYKKIAAYNKIKNPDYIISGTTILIPAE